MSEKHNSWRLNRWLLGMQINIHEAEGFARGCPPPGWAVSPPSRARQRARCRCRRRAWPGGRSSSSDEGSTLQGLGQGRQRRWPLPSLQEGRARPAHSSVQPGFVPAVKTHSLRCVGWDVHRSPGRSKPRLQNKERWCDPYPGRCRGPASCNSPVETPLAEAAPEVGKTLSAAAPALHRGSPRSLAEATGCPV